MDRDSERVAMGGSDTCLDKVMGNLYSAHGSCSGRVPEKYS
jgi:hypothetical protein